MRQIRLFVTSAAALLVALAASLAGPQHAYAQLGNIFGNSPPRPPSNVPRDDGRLAPGDEDEDVPDLPQQGRVLPTPNRPLPPPPPGASLSVPGPMQGQPLPPPPGTTQAPPGSGLQGQQPGAGVAPNANPLPSLPPGQRQPRAAPGTAPPTPATLQPGDEVVTEPPAQKITNKQAVFSGLDKITGRIISFDVDINETVQFGALRVRPRVCYTRPATENANTDAFVEVEEITLQGEVRKIFSGWMFAASPGLHGVEHPIYDIWLTDCKGPDTTIAQDAPPPPPKPAAPPPAKRPPRPQPQQQLQQQPLPPQPLPGFR
jgi:hypothetical protein